MFGLYAYTPRIWLPAMVSVALAALGTYSWRRRRLAGALPFSVASLFASLWIIGSVMESAAVDGAAKTWWFQFQSVWQLPTVTAMTCFALEYAQPGRWLSRRNLALLFLPSLGFALLVLAGNPGNLVWVRMVADGDVTALRGPANWFVLVYAYVLSIVEVLALVGLFIRSPLHRWQVVIILAAKVGARSAYLLQAIRMAGVAEPSDDLIVGFVAVVYAVALFGFRVFDPMAQAQQLAIAQMQDGMLVLDQEGKVASANPAAQEMLGMGIRSAIGKDLRSVWPDGEAAIEAAGEGNLEWSEWPATPGGAHREILFAARYLKDFRGLPSGRLLLFRDVTRERLAQARSLEQQRSIATLVERDRLARELHDSLGQILAGARLQADSAVLLLQKGDNQAVRHSLMTIGAMARDAEVDIREYIVGARSFAAVDLPFFARLEQYLASYGAQHELDVRLTVGPELGRGGFQSEMENQLLRIIQEALSNVRKHAAATNVKLAFTVDGGSWSSQSAMTARDSIPRRPGPDRAKGSACRR